jgi:hypothetical protein
MRLKAFYFMGALAVAAIPLSAGAQSLSQDYHWKFNSQAIEPGAQQCPAGYDFEHGGYMGGGMWRPPHCASRSKTVMF